MSTSCVKYLLQQPWAVWLSSFRLALLYTLQKHMRRRAYIKYTLKESKTMMWRKFPVEIPAVSPCVRELLHTDNQGDWCLFSFHPAVQRKAKQQKPNWLDGKFSGQVKLRHNGGFWKTTNQCLQKSNRSEEHEAAGNSLSQHYDNNSCFRRQKS